jgi:hypothetical protein
VSNNEHHERHPVAHKTLTPSEELIQRYSRVERHADVFGRVVGVRRLKPSQSTKISEMTPNLDGDAEMTVLDEKTGAETTMKIPRRLQMNVAASVCEIDNVPIPFARNRGELDAIYDRLDREGMDAAMTAFFRLLPKRETDDEGAADPTDSAKK